MTHPIFLRIGLLSAAILTMNAVPLLAAQTDTAAKMAEATKASPAGRLEFVKKLIETSSAARQVEASGNPQALMRREEARQIYQKAVESNRRGDNEQTAKLLMEASKIMFEAVRLADQEKVVAEKKLRDYQNRLDSINALMDAHNRVSEEKRANKAARRLRGQVQDKLNQATSLKARGDLDQAKAALDDAYVLAKVAIEDLRGGDTLVRSLNFASKKDEYHYEIDRNDTHRMLIDVLLKEKMDTASVGKMVRGFQKKSADLRKQAEREAAKGRYAQAVKTLEESTKELVRAIRAAGIYIPG